MGYTSGNTDSFPIHRQVSPPTLSAMTNKAATVFILVILGLGFSSASQQSVIGKLRERTTESYPGSENSTLPILSRQRRYVVFPAGSSIQAVYCLALHSYIPLTKRFQTGLTLGLAWMLPTEAHELYLQKRDVDHTRAELSRGGYGVQHRVDMYKLLEGLLGLKGLNGRDCLMRAVCEAYETTQAQTSSGEHKQGSFMAELHKLLFALPIHPNHKTPYDDARKNAGQCGQVFSGCPSFLNFIPKY